MGVQFGGVMGKQRDYGGVLCGKRNALLGKDKDEGIGGRRNREEWRLDSGMFFSEFSHQATTHTERDGEGFRISLELGF